MLLIGSALLIRTAMALGRVDPGFDTHNVLTLKMSLKGAQYEKAEAVEQVVRNGVEKLRVDPGRRRTRAPPAACRSQGGYGLPFRIVGRPLAADSQGPFHGGGGWMTVSPGYFEVFKIPVKRGRTFNERDTSTSTPVVVINEAMAQQYWPKARSAGRSARHRQGRDARVRRPKGSGRSSASSPTSRATASTASRSRRCSSRRRRCPMPRTR